MGISLEIPDNELNKIADLVINKLKQSGALAQPKPWLTMKEARAESGLSGWEIRKRIRAGVIEIHQPNPGRPPLMINRNSLLRSMEA